MTDFWTRCGPTLRRKTLSPPLPRGCHPPPLTKPLGKETKQIVKTPSERDRRWIEIQQGGRK